MTDEIKPNKQNRILAEMEELKQKQVSEGNLQKKIIESPKPDYNQLWYYECNHCNRVENGFKQRIDQCPKCGRSIESELVETSMFSIGRDFDNAHPAAGAI